MQYMGWAHSFKQEPDRIKTIRVNPKKEDKCEEEIPFNNNYRAKVESKTSIKKVIK